MPTETTDILVSGGGIAGLMATLVMARAGFSVTCVDPAPAIVDATDNRADLRTTAFLQSAQALLAEAGIWDALSAQATPLQVMRIVDADPETGQPRAERSFDAADISDQPFGWNLPNAQIRAALLDALDRTPGANLRTGCGLKILLAREAEALIGLTDGTALRARLCIGADGRNSPTRAALGIGTRDFRYGQKAIVFAVTHDSAHDNTSTEVHRDGGPFTLVPLPDLDGRPCSSVVWMAPGPEVKRLMALEEAAFCDAATARSAGVQGALKLAGRRVEWPIIGMLADDLTGPRSALIAEAAHVVPPIGAQGLNMSLGDIRKLRDLAAESPEQLGGRDMLDAYARARKPATTARVLGIDALNRASIAGRAPMRDLRAEVIKLIHDTGPVRLGLMRAGLGAG